MFLEPVVISPEVSCHFFEDQLLLFSQKTQGLYELNQSAALIWLCCERQMSLDDISLQLSQSFGVERSQAKTDASVLMAHWAGLGLIRDDSESHEQNPEDHDVGPAQNALIDKPYGIHAEPQTRLGIAFGGLNYMFRFYDQRALEQTSQVIAHLESHVAQAQVYMDVIYDLDHFLIVCNGVIVDAFIDPNEIAPRTAYHLVISAYTRADFLISVHSAALSMGSGCIMFPGNCGVGKTTLSAALIKAGFIHYTDDTVILDRKSRKIIPAPVSLRVKEGSWDIVEKMFPGSLSMSVHYTGDKRRLRYLSPSVGKFVSTLTHAEPVKAIIFPQYSPEIGTGIRSIPKIEAFRRIQECGYDVGPGLDRVRVDELLDWIKGVDCHEMTIGPLDEAIPMIRRIAV